MPFRFRAGGSTLAPLVLTLGLCACAQAQDPFEIHVYTYEPPKLGHFRLEQHLNYWAKGSKEFDGTVPPTNDQFHMNYELTGGLGKGFALGFMQLSAVRPGGGGLEYAGWRVLPHAYAPESWHLPVELGLVVELSFVKSTYAADSRRIEIRPIVEKQLGRLQMVLNPVVARALHGPGIREGWVFAPAARAGWGSEPETRKLLPYLEWYSEVGTIGDLSPASRQVHLLYPGVDWRVKEHLLWSVGVGVGLTSMEPRLVIKSRLEYSFGGHK